LESLYKFSHIQTPCPAIFQFEIRIRPFKIVQTIVEDANIVIGGIISETI